MKGLMRNRTFAAGIGLLAGMAVIVAACSSPPRKVRGRLGPDGGEIEIENPDPTLGPLPQGWTPTEEANYCFEADGKHFCRTLCIATNPSNPNCVYVNVTGSCDPNNPHWTIYCENNAQHAPEVIAPPPSEILPVCETDSGTVTYDNATGDVGADFELPCGVEIDLDLVDVYIAHPSAPGTFLPSLDFIATYGNVAPSGSVVTFDGDPDIVAWNAYRLGFEWIGYTSVTGQEIVSAINEVEAAGHTLPVADTFVNGVNVDSRVIHIP